MSSWKTSAADSTLYNSSEITYDVALLQLGIIKNLLNGLEGLLEEVAVQLLELGAGKCL